jgi:hypothetical protein
MKFLITESQKSSIRDMITKSILEKGILRTIENFKLNLKTLDLIYKNSEIPKLTCYELSQLIAHLINNDLVKRDDIKKGDYNVDVSMNDFTSAVFFEVTNLKYNDSLSGYATPYWHGECGLPIDVEYYSWPKNDGRHEDVEIEGEYYRSLNLDRTKFSTFSEIKTWIEDVYPQILIDVCSPLFKDLRESF